MKTQYAISNKEKDCVLNKKIAPPSEAKFFKKMFLIIKVFPFIRMPIEPPTFVELFSFNTQSTIFSRELDCDKKK